jgi:hypothetical protein
MPGPQRQRRRDRFRDLQSNARRTCDMYLVLALGVVAGGQPRPAPVPELVVETLAFAIVAAVIGLTILSARRRG